MEEQNSRQEQFDVGLLADLKPLDELERKITSIIGRFDQLQKQNEDFKSRIETLEDDIEKKNQEIEQLRTAQDELLLHQQDPGRENHIRQRIQNLLEKLEGF